MKQTFAIIGRGRAGTALDLALKKAGYVPRNVERAEMVFITTPDREISAVCAQIAQADQFKQGAFVIHLSGAHPSTILGAARDRGALIGSMHPLTSFAQKQIDDAFAGVAVSVEGDASACALIERVARDIGARPFAIDTDAKALYHAAAAMACNHLVTVERLAVQLLEKAGVSREGAWDVLGPLVRKTVANIEQVGVEQALTGPIARGDIETLKLHLAAIEARTPDLLPVYKQLGLHTVDIAEETGKVDQALVDAMRVLLER
jgi:predicted short-subunit dehydrogenase-like oxidoreductase (DUF2520 family)